MKLVVKRNRKVLYKYQSINHYADISKMVSFVTSWCVHIFSCILWPSDCIAAVMSRWMCPRYNCLRAFLTFQRLVILISLCNRQQENLMDWEPDQLLHHLCAQSQQKQNKIHCFLGWLEKLTVIFLPTQSIWNTTFNIHLMVYMGCMLMCFSVQICL